ncbi:MAG: hypothetical protein LBC13_01830, partial [Clostridiales bacterium]|nr:hypothetical protein [Clostridiales bacterium]
MRESRRTQGSEPESFRRGFIRHYPCSGGVICDCLSRTNAPYTLKYSINHIYNSILCDKMEVFFVKTAENML